jgi:hypothetical protein
MKCHRLECGHAWHAALTNDARSPLAVADPAHCTCGEIAPVNTLMVEGRRHEALGENLTQEAFEGWLAQVLQALDGIPAELGAPPLVRSATTAAKSQTNGLSKKTANLNKLLAKAIQAVS